MIQVNDVVMCISPYQTMNIGSYGIVKSIFGNMTNVEVAGRVGQTGSLTATMKIADLKKVGILI